jgi:hypothetical protein
MNSSRRWTSLAAGDPPDAPGLAPVDEPLLPLEPI